ncbi:hypothetical protein [Azospirillum agricola]|uniref:hypothetical protein n=1 Tax=Azospirillum agricola TaxID=1720247 RepID=UPI000A0F04F9|nr:hypothetical protein [Azospirillum agricola]SMH61573.1 hypothetical protein SAMN02982994_5915 [Azospirillum lipoferum]
MGRNAAAVDARQLDLLDAPERPDSGAQAHGEPTRYGRWTVIAPLPPKIYDDGTKHERVLCRCECGSEGPVSLSSLKAGKSRQCRSCAMRSRGRTVEVRPGNRFGNWAVISEVMDEGIGPRKVLCECVCSTRQVLKLNTLRMGKSTRCKQCRYEEAKTRIYPHRSSRTQAEACAKQIFATYQSVAKRNGRVFTLSFEDVQDLITRNCRYCGVPPCTQHRILFSGKQPYPGEPFLYNGIDRVDNAVGYVRENCVSCCKRCNQAKLDMDVGDFKAWLRQVHLYQKRVASAS